MQVRTTRIVGVVVFTPQVHRDDRGHFTRTFDVATAREAGIDGGMFCQDSQSRSRRGVVRGLHLRSGAGEAKLVRCARGAIFDVLLDARHDSPTLGTVETFELDDVSHETLFVPPGVAHGWQALTEPADVCYRISAEHDPAEDVAIRFDDPDLGIPWPEPVTLVSHRDAIAPAWSSVRESYRLH
ncbi:MAG: dTDP-4-dehydrorhamnose 3,5-epimerase family protein [Nostocoides sp.]